MDVRTIRGYRNFKSSNLLAISRGSPGSHTVLVSLGQGYSKGSETARPGADVMVQQVKPLPVNLVSHLHTGSNPRCSRSVPAPSNISGKAAKEDPSTQPLPPL